MKFLTLVFLFITLPIYADLQDVSKILSSNPQATFTVHTGAANNPVKIEVKIKDKVVAWAIASPLEFVNSVRKRIAPRTIKSGDYTYVMNWQSLSYIKKDKSIHVYDLLADIQELQADAKYCAEEENREKCQKGQYPWFISENYKLLTVVGPYVSYSAIGSNYIFDAPYTTPWNNVSTVDVRKLANDSKSNRANLLDLVTTPSLLSALKADTALNERIEDNSIAPFKAAKTMQQLEATLNNFDECLAFPNDGNTIYSFVIYDYDKVKDTVSIRLALVPKAHPCEGTVTPRLGLQLKPLPEFKKFLLESKKWRWFVDEICEINNLCHFPLRLPQIKCCLM